MDKVKEIENLLGGASLSSQLTKSLINKIHIVFSNVLKWSNCYET
jgi:hypothetical protein